jgi:hypothetical protein
MLFSGSKLKHVMIEDVRHYLHFNKLEYHTKKT